MRNDAHDDLDELPTLNTERVEPQINTPATDELPFLDDPITTSAQPSAASSNKAVGALSAVTLAIFCSALAFGWWSMQRIELLEQQLIATQDSFSKISEDAAGRISAITGQVSATESSVLSDTQALKKRLDTFESNAVDTHKQQQSHLTEHAAQLNTLRKDLTSQNERSNTLTNSLAEQQTALTRQGKTLTEAQSQLQTELTAQHEQIAQLEQTLKSTQQQLAQLEPFTAELATLSAQLSQLQESANRTDDIQRLQQDLLILRSELEQRPAATPSSTAGPSLDDFDAYRAQTNRTISTLQEQVRTLQKNTP